MRFFAHYWGVALLLLPMFIFNNQLNDTRLCKDYLLFALTVGSCLIWHGSKIRINHIIVSVLILFSVWFSIDNFYTSAVIQQTTYITCLILLCINLARNVNAHLRETIVHYFRAALIIQILFFITQYFGFNIYNPSHKIPYVVGSLGQQTLSAAFIACLIPFTLSIRWLWIGLIGLVCIVHTTSAMALIGLVSGVIVFYMGRHSLKVIPVAAVALIFAASSKLEFFADNSRYIVWVSALKQFCSWDTVDMLLGKGFGYVTDGFKSPGQRFIHLHNDYLEVLWSLGLLGLAGLLSGLGWLLCSSSLLWKPKNRPLASSMTVILVNSLGNFPLFISSIMLVFMICYSIVITKLEDN
jgi:hypothetical protein